MLQRDLIRMIEKHVGMSGDNIQYAECEHSFELEFKHKGCLLFTVYAKRTTCAPDSWEVRNVQCFELISSLRKLSRI